MSARDVELVRALQPGPQANLIDFFGELDESSARATAVFAEDFVCIQHGLDSEPRTGLRGLREGWRNWLSPWESYRTEIEDVRDGEGCVLVLTRDFARRPGMETEIEMVAAAVWTIRDGKVTRIEFFPDRGDAYAAAGVSRDC